eukprot:CAMPEP_0170567124 /NCGR_PEP_ID=MMETSP0211-20121228/80282_1 /TAXON_ID=311385 /ORGANISM="Pseudokeronopsis sp., Strain OXSARD2" /LENGTH=104 /DNA_ID=CAMNT_0010888499 /DNA_START=607 /DNA_END=921 /DNA_ORIENTATION=-
MKGSISGKASLNNSNLNLDDILLEDASSSQVPGINKGVASIKFEVTDTGIGMINVDRDKLFQVFSKVDDGNEQLNPTGIGFGLTICNKILEQFGSRMEVRSTYG